LGANRVQTFCAITLPLALPAILAAFLFAFMSSFDEVTATLFWLPANIQTVPSQIMAMLQYSADQKINALSALLILASILLAFLALTFGRVFARENRRGART
jgi:spermidine/putrescine transport system permease protein